MKITKRFDSAVVKLYTAFHNGELNAMDCKMCAVGNMCDNDDSWIYTFETNTGYSKSEIENIESIFMCGSISDFTRKWSGKPNIKGCFTGYGWDAEYVNKNNEDLLFIALCAVVEYLCELDNIPNVMDYTKLFETENNQPKYQL